MNDEAMSTITEIIESELRKWKNIPNLEPSVTDSSDINNGHCKMFARSVQDTARSIPDLPTEDIRIRTWGYDQSGYTSYAHVWIEYNSRHYDAECPDGVDDPSNLPLFQRGEIDPNEEQSQ